MELIIKYFTRFNPKVAVLDIFILSYSILPFLFTFLFTMSWVNQSMDTALLLYQVSFMILFTALTLSIPQLNTFISRIMMVWIFILNIFLATTIVLNIRVPQFGDDNIILRHLTDIIILSISIVICTNKSLTNWLTKIKQVYVINK